MAQLVQVTQKGNWRKTYKFLEAIRQKRMYSILNAYGEKGVSLLSAATPVRTGATAAAWYYTITMSDSEVGIEWHNNRMANDGRTPVAILIQMGHGTRNGGYVPPKDFINPAMKPLFDEIADAVWKVVTSQ